MEDSKLIQFATREKDDWLVWDVLGRLDRTTSGEAVVEGEKVLNTTDKLLMNLKELEYISSAGLRAILSLTKKADSAGKVFSICAPSGIVKLVLEEASIDVFVTVYETEEEVE